MVRKQQKLLGVNYCLRCKRALEIDLVRGEMVCRNPDCLKYVAREEHTDAGKP